MSFPYPTENMKFPPGPPLTQEYPPVTISQGGPQPGIPSLVAASAMTQETPMAPLHDYRGEPPPGRPGNDRRRPAGGRFGGGPPPKRRNEEFRYPQNGEIYLRFLIRSRDGGGIIGKGGQNIKRLRDQYKAHVSLPDSHGAPERILTVAHTDIQVVLEIMRDIIPKLEVSSQDHRRDRDNRDMRDMRDKHEVQLLVPQDQVGSIIGRAGFKIKELREKCGAFVKVFSDPMPGSTERVVDFQGTLDQVVGGIDITIRVLLESPPRMETMYYYPGAMMERSYPPDFFDYDYPPPPDMPSYGHPPPRGHFDDFYDSPRGGGGGGGSRGGRGPRGPRGGGGGGGRPYHGPSGNPPYMPPGMPGDHQRPAISGYGPDFVPNGPGVTSQQVTIPNELAGAIIGRGGERIRQTRQQSNCGIKLAPSNDDLNDRIITITGTPESIVIAQRIMQQSVRAAGGPQVPQ